MDAGRALSQTARGTGCRRALFRSAVCEKAWACFAEKDRGGGAGVTYDGPVTIHMNGEEVRLIPIRSAHTGGDTLGRFPGLGGLVTGDYYRSIQYPNIDRANSGPLNGMREGSGGTIGLAGLNTKIIPGHGPAVDRNAVIAHWT